MPHRRLKTPCLIALSSLLLPLAFGGTAHAQMRITEWMYNNTPEFVEFTNVGLTPIDMTGWSYDDSSRAPGSESLSAFGVVAPHESVVFAEGLAATFRTQWNLPASLKVIGNNTNNLSRGDEINLYDNTSALIDRLTYDDQNIGGPRTQDKSGNPLTLAALGANDPAQWKLAVVGDVYGSYQTISNATGGPFTQIANPGVFTLLPPIVPEPSSLALLAIGAIVAAMKRHRS